MNQKTKVLEKRIWITDEDVAEYRNLENEYDLFIENTIENIKTMVLHGADLQAYDIQGKSVSDHCYSYEIYYALRDLGAPLSFNDQIGHVIVTGLFVMVTATAGVMIIKACYRTCFPQ